MKNCGFNYFKISLEELKEEIKGFPVGIQNWHISRWYEENYCDNPKEERYYYDCGRSCEDYCWGFAVS